MEGCFKELMRAEGGEPETGNHPRDLCFRGSSIAIRDTICSVQVGQETQSVHSWCVSGERRQRKWDADIPRMQSAEPLGVSIIYGLTEDMGMEEWLILRKITLT